MASFVPVISTNAGGLPEVNIDGFSGYTCDVGDVKSMSEKAANWSQNYTLDMFETEISKLIHHS